ncbi:DUF3274 domain-containing protein [Caballeronia sp. GAWG1-1]|uniref:T6SS effector phospholipase Tle3 domain-containing protein n=1 Tax=Caballeronia sp. GAWG1-1 TaxID=2921742 RepID=UPI002028544C|nr:DUF3274 domain-containing protein [Caballeronia sp. GAWG1-1]
MSDTSNNQSQIGLRNASHGQQAMPMPSGSGAMLTCKVPAKRPMPCIVIVIHGVNDDGQCMPLVDKHICAGLNKRLGRDDLTPHKWGTWTEGSENNLPQLTPGALPSSPCILEEGRSPVIPFHWGYRAVDKKLYQDDQRRYKAQLDAKNSNPDLPYDAYYIDRRDDPAAGYACRDNFENWLSESYSKDGGPFPNATTNLVDMWGPGVGGRLYNVGAAAAKLGVGSEARLYKNPHRIYYVHAARRLADLILEVRRHPLAANDAINIIAHSQGTEITMLANFMVREAGLRPVDNVILFDSPYALDPTTIELEYPGRHQSRDARVQTLSNFSKMLQVARRPVDTARVVSTGVANAAAWSKTAHARDNFGSVFNYFCPQDTVVSLPNIQGMGWQGVEDSAAKAVGQNFLQRVFSDGHIVGTAPEKFTVPHGKFPIPSDEGKRTINGPPIPEPYKFFILTGTDRLGEHLAGTALAAEGAKTVRKVVDSITGVESDPLANQAPSNVVQASVVNSALQARGYPFQVTRAWQVRGSSNLLMVDRFETKAEGLSRLAQRRGEWSQHSAITLNHETIEKCMAYDIAVGLSVAFDDEKFWWRLLRRADWRHPNNPDSNAKQYFASGVLPPDIKQEMNKPNLPSGLVSRYAPPAKADVLAFPVVTSMLNIYDDLTTPTGGTGQWPLPAPKLEG